FDGNDVIILKSGGAGGTVLDVIGQIAGLNSIPPSPALITPNVNGQVLEFDLGDLSNNDSDGSVEQVILEYDVLVLNTADNNRTDDKTNTISFNYLNRDGMGQSVTDTETVTVVEPELSLSKSASPTSVQGGSTVTFTVIFANSSNTNVTRAWEQSIVDILPAEYQNLALTSATLSRGATDISGCVSIATNTITLDTDDVCLAASERYLGPGENITLIYTADVDPTIGFEQQVVNTATGSATSLPGTNGTDDATPGAPGTNTGERDASGDVNDLLVSDNATVTADKPTLTKTGDASLQILETTTMTLTVDVPVGTTNNFVITDDLPSGLRYTGTATITPPAANFTASNTPVAPAAGTDPLVFDFGTVANSATSAQTITITYEVEVENILANQNTTSLVNTATLTYQDASMPFPSDTATVTVIEPNLEVTKTIESGAAGSDAGDTIEYELVVRNTAVAGTAYRVDLRDVLPGNLLGAPDGTGTAPFFLNITVDNDGGAVVKNAGGALVAGDAVFATTNETDDTLTWPLFDMPPGTTLIITYEAVLSNFAVAGEMLTNTATVSYNSLPDGGGRDGSDGDDDDTASTLNNYNEADSADLTVDSSIAIQKALNATHADNDFTIGDLITFDVRVDVIEGVVGNVVVTDVLPAGLDFEGPVRIVAGSNISYDGTGVAVEAPAGTLTIDMGDVTNTSDSNSANDFFIIEIDARVLDVPGNAAGNPALTNSVNLTSDVGPAGPDTQNIDIVEPNLVISKVPSDTTPTLGDVVTFTVTVRHDTSSADAFDVILTDAIPAGLSYVPGSTAGQASVNETDPS
ncbi:MAG: isopeptide-forming domain-containing fimbrial protein, partial [Candidatus Competibacteraceae bacterium]|nr:isopeptide-forming domain-containing fimbrial protein [Candidatus Competibacteraceae bacterium]